MTRHHGFPFQVAIVDTETGEVVVNTGSTWEGAMELRKMFMANGFHVIIEQAEPIPA